MSLSIEEWHKRFTTQAGWTRSLRQHLFQLARLDRAKRVLEVGCGSGAVLGEIPQFTQAEVHGLDIERGYLDVAMRNTPELSLIQGDAHRLPFANSSYDLTFCHFLLLWVSRPAEVLQEMKRITHPGGMVAALAEPDYGGRLDYPPELSTLGKLQTEALRKQGANPDVGRQLRSLLSNLGLENVEAGVLGGHWELPFDETAWQSEWSVLEADLADDAEFQKTKEVKKAQDRAAWAQGTRTLYVPTFYAWGIVPG